ncbi:unnamed protein product [Caenorhabditis auriculariae]|uniref:Uncharacterized protein n=1 Tax=Caenorhabditis auriculariae TaxID=2777116 RepID=A0A8S1HAA1_9PELO|nr:unnamed protein product [Caenorhabditis auriculariae]
MASSILSAFCSFMCMQNASDIAVYAYHAQPLQFQHASMWYFTRLRALAVVCGAQSILSGAVLCVLYLGVNCRYRTFVQLSQKPTVPDLVERITYFA